MEIIAYIASVFIGISLGLIGGGGSILTVPVMVYLFGVSPLLATSYSLFIVGTTSMVGAYQNVRKGDVNFKTVALFGLSSITTVFLTRNYIIPRIPAHLFNIGQFEVTENFLTMVLFALLMLAAGYAMIIPGKNKGKEPVIPLKVPLGKLLFYGLIIGLVTGLLGAGGGFLLIPMLVILVHLPMKEAVGTSLLIISLNSLIGFSGDIGHFTINWYFLLKISFIAIAGVMIGGWINKKVQGEKLKKGFGWFVLFMAGYILLKELL
ncbi:sulfite exporter TauE/SafE family protein [Pedobacter sp.]|uniref:sulfite exporter TauE/SafE family protein n=1 Tax=Pedobacter sp. TaxID=1411316 RepID=UPI003D7FDBC0